MFFLTHKWLITLTCNKSRAWGVFPQKFLKWTRAERHINYRSASWRHSCSRRASSSPYTNDRRSAYVAGRVLCWDRHSWIGDLDRHTCGRSHSRSRCRHNSRRVCPDRRNLSSETPYGTPQAADSAIIPNNTNFTHMINCSRVLSVRPKRNACNCWISK